MRKIILLLLISMPLFAMKFDIHYLEDKTNSMTLQKFSTLSNDKLIFLTQTGKHFQYSDAKFWLKVDVVNDSDDLQELILEFKDIRLDSMTLYDASLKPIGISGDMIAFKDRPIATPKVAFPLKLNVHEKKRYFILAKNRLYIDLSYKIYPVLEFESSNSINNKILYIYIGAALIMILYNLFIFLFIREQAFLDYTLFNSMFLILVLSKLGFFLQYLFPSKNDLDLGNVSPFLTLLAILFLLRFVNNLFNIKGVFPLLFKYSVYISVFSGTAIVLLTTYYSKFTIILMNIGVFVAIVWIFFVGIYMAKKGHKVAYIFLFAWIVLIVNIIMILLATNGVIENNFYIDHGMPIGSFFEMALLSIALAYRYKEQNDILKKKDIELKNINNNLEKIVELRNFSLKEEVEKTKRLLDKNTLLYKELNHRVKNNLQIIISMFSMQSFKSQSSEVKEAILQANQRIKTLAYIHENLQGDMTLEYVPMQSYLEMICKTYQNINPNIIILVYAHNIKLHFQMVNSLGLIVNELLSNSFKHAFKESKNGKITLSLTALDEYIKCEYQDNGTTFNINQLHTKNSLGMSFIEGLSKEQLEGDMCIESRNGFYYSLIFKDIE